jgi:hypothetical protein
MDRLATGLSAGLGPPWFGSALADLSAAGLLRWWFVYDAYAPPVFVRGAFIAGGRRIARRRRGHRHVGLARARSQEGDDLRLGALG